jgi:ribosome-binding protein aMBF1 (putative translation factor)
MNRIKEVIKDNGIFQTWLADKMGKSYNIINEYARNTRQSSFEDFKELQKSLILTSKY